MTEQEIINTKDKATHHLYYVGAVLLESIENFHRDLLADRDRPASDILCRSSFSRMMELKESLEKAIKFYFTLS